MVLSALMRFTYVIVNILAGITQLYKKDKGDQLPLIPPK